MFRSLRHHLQGVPQYNYQKYNRNHIKCNYNKFLQDSLHYKSSIKSLETFLSIIVKYYKGSFKTFYAAFIIDRILENFIMRLI